MKQSKFFHVFKTELNDHKIYATREDAKRDLFQCIEGFYNRQRINSALGYLRLELIVQKIAKQPPIFLREDQWF